MVLLKPLFGICAGSPGVMQLGAAEQSPVVQQLQSIRKTPVFSLMVALRSDDVAMLYDAASVSGSAAILWISRDSSKPGRGSPRGCHYKGALCPHASSLSCQMHLHSRASMHTVPTGLRRAVRTAAENLFSDREFTVQAGSGQTGLTASWLSRRRPSRTPS